MKRVLAVPFAALAVLGCARSGAGNHGNASLAVESISATEAAEQLERGEAVLVDVREENEIRRGMAEPAYWMPLSMIRREDAEWVRFVKNVSRPPGKLVILYCESGGRSNFVAESLSRLSVRTANLGNYDYWKDAGLPVKTPEHPVPGAR